MNTAFSWKLGAYYYMQKMFENFSDARFHPQMEKYTGSVFNGKKGNPSLNCYIKDD